MPAITRKKPAKVAPRPQVDWLVVAMSQNLSYAPNGVLDLCLAALGARKLELRKQYWPDLRPVGDEFKNINRRVDLLVNEVFQRQYSGLFFDPASLSDQRGRQAHPLL